MFACQQSCSVILCSLSLLIAVSETGEEDDNICYARRDWKIGGSKVSNCKLQALWEWTVLLAFAEYVVYFVVKALLDYVL